MELKETDGITQLLCDINLYQRDSPQISSTKVSLSQTSSSFHFKLKYLLGVPYNSSFSNVEIEIASLLKDIESYLNEETQKNELDEEKAKEIKEEIKNAMIDEKKIELDSCFVNVKGKQIIKCFKSLEKYSFPSQEEKILENESYVIFVESPNSMRSQIHKKTE